MAVVAILAGFILGMGSIVPGQATYAIVLILVGTTVGWRGAVFVLTRERKEAAPDKILKTPPKRKKTRASKKQMPKAGKHRA